MTRSAVGGPTQEPGRTVLRLRPARPEDIERVVPLMHDSSRDLIDAVFGDVAPGLLRRDFLAGRGVFGYRQQVVGALPEGEVVATMTVYEGRRYRRLSVRTLASTAGHVGPRRLLPLARRSRAVADLFVPPSRDAVFLANVCVAAGQRSRGHGSVLVRHAAQVARERGARAVELDVSVSNIRARQLYERLGFRVIEVRHDVSGHRLDGFCRMSLPLNPATTA